MGEKLILLVEDDHDLREFLQGALPYYGSFTIIAAADGITGLEMLTEHHPSCAIIDVKMPGLDGYQLARAIRGDPDTALTPLIILTALTQDRDRFTGLASGADRFLQKPATPQALAETIAEVVTQDLAIREQRLRKLATEEDGAHE